MFDIKEFKYLLHFFNKKVVPIKKNDKLPISDSNYIDFIQNFDGLEITADIQIFGYEEAIRENKYVIDNAIEISNLIWMIGRSGQGDEWFLNKKTQQVLFYDHNLGEYTSMDDFKDLGISFSEFIQFGFIMKEFEEELDKNTPVSTMKNEFTNSINKISINLLENYPYKYWDE